jgi:hypothetical protein
MHAHPIGEDKRLADNALRAFIAACDSAREQARGEVAALAGMDRPEGVRRARRAWVAIQRARIFAVHPMSFARAYRQADVRTHEDLAGIPWVGPEAVAGPSGQEPKIFMSDVEGDPERLMVVLSEAGRRRPFPRDLPFDAIFISYGAIGISIDNVAARVGTSGLSQLWALGFRMFALNGHLLSAEGDDPVVFSFVSAARPDDPSAMHCMLIRAFEHGAWDHPYDLDAWVVPALVDAINQHRSVRESQWTPGQRLERRSRERAGALPIPKPYYVVRLEDELVDHAARAQVAASRLTREYSHRFDVRGHECVRVLRGTLPVDPEVRDQLELRGYRIYASGEPLSPEDAQRIEGRNVRPRATDEWIAVLSYWRDAHVKGPEGAPYVPALRT